MTISTTSEMMPTMCDGNGCSTGKPNPVTLVATVVIRKSAVHPSSCFPPRRPIRTTNPAPIPTRLSTKCTNVKVSSVIS